MNVGTKGSKIVKKNNHLQGVLRPHTFTMSDTKGGDVQKAVDAKMGRMFGSIVTYSISLNTWRDPSGSLWEPNTLIKINAPDVMINGDYLFLVKSVSLTKDTKKETCDLTLVLPGAFSEEIPQSLPWD